MPTLDTVLRRLIDPLWPILTMLIGAVATQWRRVAMQRWAKFSMVAAISTLWIISTPFGALVLERPLVVESKLEAGWVPQYIYVLPAGYDLGDVPEHDSSGLETTRRVNRAAELWRRYPMASIVMAGSQPGMESLRDARQQGLLMKAQAERLGVVTEKIIIESQSLNTNGHAKVARDSRLHQPDDALAIVTSDFHLRRSRKEFSRFFGNIRMIGSDPSSNKTSFAGTRLDSFLPTVDALSDSTIYLREYVALLVSDLRD